jgi:hypothetical protein
MRTPSQRFAVVGTSGWMDSNGGTGARALRRHSRDSACRDAGPASGDLRDPDARPSAAAAVLVRGRPCPKSAVPPVPARLLILCLLFRSSWRRVEGDRHIGAAGVHIAAPGSPGGASRCGFWRPEAVVSGVPVRGSQPAARSGGELRSTPNDVAENLRPYAATGSLFAYCELRRVAMLVG